MRFFLALFLLAGSAFAQTDDVERNLRAAVGYLASDELQGRGTATPFEAAAAAYLASELERLGLAPAGDPLPDGRRSYLQRFEFQYGAIPKGLLRVLNAEGRAGAGRSQNVIGVLPGTTNEAIVLSAHYDHAAPKAIAAPGEDAIFNGADDDASGTAAVLELARALVKGPKPRRSVYFVLFGAEEFGAIGSEYFNQRPPVPLEQIVANLEFEMLGRADPKVAPGKLWLTGFERSDLGSTLAKHGAPLVADPHPEQNFFQRSDNYRLALKGIVAHTVSSFGLHPQYHKPDDDVAHIDFKHLAQAVRAMIAPVRWLADSEFKPAWAPGMRPTPKASKQ